MEDRIIAVAVAILLVGSITMLLHERHYQSRKEMILESRVATLEKIIGESRGS